MIVYDTQQIRNPLHDFLAPSFLRMLLDIDEDNKGKLKIRLSAFPIDPTLTANSVAIVLLDLLRCVALRKHSREVLLYNKKDNSHKVVDTVIDYSQYRTTHVHSVYTETKDVIKALTGIDTSEYKKSSPSSPFLRVDGNVIYVSKNVYTSETPDTDEIQLYRKPQIEKMKTLIPLVSSLKFREALVEKRRSNALEKLQGDRKSVV